LSDDVFDNLASGELFATCGGNEIPFKIEDGYPGGCAWIDADDAAVAHDVS